MRISKIIGMGVLDKNANILGKVTDIDFNVTTWTITHIIVKTGLVNKLSIGVEKTDKVGDKLILKVGREDLQK